MKWSWSGCGLPKSGRPSLALQAKRLPQGAMCLCRGNMHPHPQTKPGRWQDPWIQHQIFPKFSILVLVLGEIGFRTFGVPLFRKTVINVTLNARATTSRCKHPGSVSSLWHLCWRAVWQCLSLDLGRVARIHVETRSKMGLIPTLNPSIQPKKSYERQREKHGKNKDSSLLRWYIRDFLHQNMAPSEIILWSHLFSFCKTVQR